MRNIAVLTLFAAISFAGTKTKTLYGIKWHGSVRKAGAAAKNKRPIFWLRMLGDLAGKT